MELLKARKEEEHVKREVWGKEIEQLLNDYHQLKILEFVDPSQQVYWKDLRDRHPNREIILHGIARDEAREGAQYGKIYREKPGKIAKKRKLKQEMPYHVARFCFLGGGDMFDIDNRYDKYPILEKFVKWQAKKADTFYLQLMFELSDEVYPFSKIEPDVLLQHEDAMNHVNTVDPNLRTVWMSMFGIALQIDRMIRQKGLSVQLVSNPVTFINHSVGESVRKVAYSFRVKRNANMPVSDVIQDLKQTVWLHVAGNAELRN